MRAIPSVVIGCLLTWSAAVLPAQAAGSSGDNITAGGGGNSNLIIYPGHSNGLLSVDGSNYVPYTGGTIDAASVNVFVSSNGVLQNLGALQKTGAALISLSSISPDSGSITVGGGATFISGGSVNLTSGSALTLDGSVTLSGRTYGSGTTLIAASNTIAISGVPIILGANSTISANGGLTLTNGSSLNTNDVVITGTTTITDSGLLTLNSGALTKNGSGTLNLNSGSGTIGSGSGTLTLNNGSNGYTGGLTIVNGGILTLNNGSTYGGSISGATISSGLNNLNLVGVTGGTLTLNGSNTYTGATIVSGGTLTLSGNTYNGATTVSGATLSFSSNNYTTSTNLVRLGTGTLTLNGSAYNAGTFINGPATLNFASGNIPQTGQITMANASTLTIDLAAAAQLSNVPLIKNGVAGSAGTTFKLLGGVLTNASAVSILYLPAVQSLASDALSLHISEFDSGVNDKYVLEMSYDPATAAALGDLSKLYLAWFDPSDNTWKNAVDGNSDGGASAQSISGAYNPSTDFVLGDYGVDTADSTVWAVVDHNSLFGVANSDVQPGSTTTQGVTFTSLAVPEPSSVALLLCGAAIFGRRSRKN